MKLCSPRIRAAEMGMLNAVVFIVSVVADQGSCVAWFTEICWKHSWTKLKLCLSCAFIRPVSLLTHSLTHPLSECHYALAVTPSIATRSLSIFLLHPFRETHSVTHNLPCLLAYSLIRLLLPSCLHTAFSTCSHSHSGVTTDYRQIVPLQYPDQIMIAKKRLFIYFKFQNA